MKQRDVSLDIIRIMACVMVVFMHSPMPSANANGPFLTALSFLTAPCIGLFFMVSGALLMPVKTDYFTFIRKRFSKIAVPTVIWSLIYIALRLYRSESEINLLQSVASIPFSPQGEGVLWFMYTLAGLYLLAPILSAWLDKAEKRELQLLLGLWAITLCYPLLSGWVMINESATGILYYFTGYAGYFVLGFYLKKYPESLSLKFSALVAISGIVLLLALKRYGVAFDFYQLFWYLSIFIASLAVVIWKTVCRYCKPVDIMWIRTFSNLTFGIYLIHILIMRYWLWHQPWIEQMTNYALQSVVVALLTLAISAMCCFGLSFFPGSRWLIAYSLRQNKK